MDKALFLDRDGTIIEAIVMDGKPHPPKNKNSVNFVVSARETLAKAMKMGYHIIVLTNQPDVGNGLQKKEEVEKINGYLIDNLPIEKIYTCYHSRKDMCPCRKPNILFFLEAKKEFNLDLSKCWMVGDRMSDIQAGYNAGCKTIFIDKNYDEEKPTNMNCVVKDISEIMEVIIDNKNLC